MKSFTDHGWNIIITRMTTFRKNEFHKSNEQTNIDKYRVAAQMIL